MREIHFDDYIAIIDKRVAWDPWIINGYLELDYCKQHPPLRMYKEKPVGPTNFITYSEPESNKD